MITKKHLARLVAMLARMDEAEVRRQRTYGDRKKGSMRSSEVADANALRAAIAELTK